MSFGYDIHFTGWERCRVSPQAGVRRVFPGSNTPQGFYSYYRYILEHDQAHRIFIIKGGPGVGKSTFF